MFSIYSSNTYFMFHFNHMEMCICAEYVAKTKGAKHLLHDSRKLNFLQYYSVDVIIYVFLIALILKKLIQGLLIRLADHLKKTKKNTQENLTGSVCSLPSR
jgi:hypothetical protein